jgi:hypothetical protein
MSVGPPSGINHFSQDIFSGIAPAEPDVNHPDYNKTRNVCSTHVEVGDNDALYIYVENDTGMPPNKFLQYLDRIKERFVEAIPGTTIIVGPHDLKFTTITKKQEFKAKLDGTL